MTISVLFQKLMQLCMENKTSSREDINNLKRDIPDTGNDSNNAVSHVTSSMAT